MLHESSTSTTKSAEQKNCSQTLSICHMFRHRHRTLHLHGIGEHYDRTSLRPVSVWLQWLGGRPSSKLAEEQMRRCPSITQFLLLNWRLFFGLCFVYAHPWATAAKMRRIRGCWDLLLRSFRVHQPQVLKKVLKICGWLQEISSRPQARRRDFHRSMPFFEDKFRCARTTRSRLSQFTELVVFKLIGGNIILLSWGGLLCISSLVSLVLSCSTHHFNNKLRQILLLCLQILLEALARPMLACERAFRFLSPSQLIEMKILLSLIPAWCCQFPPRHTPGARAVGFTSVYYRGQILLLAILTELSARSFILLVMNPRQKHGGGERGSRTPF